MHDGREFWIATANLLRLPPDEEAKRLFGETRVGKPTVPA
jgi:hypothetical protein